MSKFCVGTVNISEVSADFIATQFQKASIIIILIVYEKIFKLSIQK